MPSSRLCALPLAALACAAAVAGCGGGSKSKPQIGKAANFSAKPGLLGNSPTAGTVQSYVPTGKIIADSGFRPDVNGFAFENYGNDAGPVNLTPTNVEHLFGTQVCAAGEGATCKLTPSAKQWMNQENAGMAGGHCMGFSVTALRFFTKNLTPDPFGASSPVALPVQGNTNLQSLIAEDFAYQNLPAVSRAAINGTPSQVLQALVSALQAGKENYTLGILKADGTGGHAITPFAVEDRGGGKLEILVYDNNFPGVVRAVDVDTNANTWHYVGGINPTDTNEIYQGDAQTKSMLLLPTSPGEGTQPCPFCTAKPNTNPNPAFVTPTKYNYIEVALAGRTDEHPHLVFTDPQGRRTGFVGGRLLQQIPGILVAQNFAVQVWGTSREPTFHLPLGHPVYKVSVDGSSLTKPLTTKITINGAGVVFYIDQIHMTPGQKDNLILPTSDLGFTYQSYSNSKFSPDLAAQFPQFDPAGSNGGTPRARLITFFFASGGYAQGSPLALRIFPETNTGVIAGPGAVPAFTGANFFLSVDSQPLNGGDRRHFYTTGNLRFDTSTQLARFHYLDPRGPTLPIDIVNSSGQRLGREYAQLTKPTH